MLYQVVLEGRTVGPYDRRTIIGMRIKKALTSEHVLIGSNGGRITVGDLIGTPRADDKFNASRSGSFSVVLATYTAALLDVQGRGIDIPRFKGEVEARVQGGVLRIAGRFRRGLGWKEDRIKFALNEVDHARVSGSVVELWLRPAKGGRHQRMVLELFTPESAGELVDWLPNATPPPQSTAASAGAPKPFNGLAVGAVGVALTVGLVLTVLLLRRMY